MSTQQRTLRLILAGPGGRYGLYRVTCQGQARDWFFLPVESQRGPTWRLTLLVQGRGAADQHTTCIGGGGHPPWCTCDGYSEVTGTCEHLEALGRLIQAGRVARK